LRAAIKLNPTMPGLHLELVNMLNSGAPSGNKAEAEKEYKLALDANPRDEISLYRLGDLAATRGENEAAMGYYTKAIQLSPDEPQANIGLARMYLVMQQPEKAAPLLENVIKHDPTNAIAHFRLSAAYRQLGRTEEMMQELVEFQKYKALKDKQRQLYSDLKLHKDEPDDNDADAEKK
jgi:Tfp pilus assembly protein PilF